MFNANQMIERQVAMMPSPVGSHWKNNARGLIAATTSAATITG
jgi:hypothetical protein